VATDDVIGYRHYFVWRTQSHFVRHNTPHPRELRARHGGKVTRKDTGDVNLGSSPPPTTSDFASAAATSPTEVSDHPTRNAICCAIDFVVCSIAIEIAARER